MAASYGYSIVAVEGWARTIALVLGLGMMAALPGQSARAETAAKPLKVVVLGDSLTAGYGLPAADAFPAKLQKALKAKGIDTEMVNAGVSGDTASGGLERLDWSVPPDADAVIVELGANDALRGTDPKVPRKALDEILKRLKARKLPVLLAGMLAPPNYGKDYATQFDAIYPDLAKQYDVPLYPFFLDGVAAVSNLNQADGIHPTAAGVDIIVERILPKVEALLRPLLVQSR
ncbi:arylesterase [Rhodopseudomonas sp. G2_2311]|uniref:arylesterase n=1 Tax=Rhodopseudomonas sp. G2_2311 TaxID=3114287 RepID=UPI0039C72BD3